jgi:hypothetical protein
MNKRIRLFFSIEPIIDAKTGIELHRGIRLLTVAQFITPQGWSEPESAIVDTGAPISLIPQKYGRNALLRL